MVETNYCLRRSFSNPSEINSLDYISQGDPVHALGESVSFGRYMSETLDWEKWSAFTQNRYLEEAERYSKPGSVAKMKAYFESHYGRFGAKKNTAQEQKNDVFGRVDAQDTPNIAVHSSSLALHPETATIISRQLCIHESSAEDNPDVDVSCDYSAQLEDKQNEATTSVESVAGVIDCPLEVQLHSSQDAEAIASVAVSFVMDTVTARENDIVSAALKRKATVKNAPEQKNPKTGKQDLTSEQNLAEYSVKRSKKSNLSKLSSSLSRLATPIRCKKERNDNPNSKVPRISSSLARLATPVRPRKEGHVTPSNQISVKDPKKILHMSINASSDINVMKKPSTTPHKAGVGKVFTPLGKIIKDTFGPSSTPRASLNSVSRHPSATPQSAARKSRVALEKSFDLSRRLEQKLKSPSVGNVKSSTHSPATFASFSFRTEERAAKRREFFQKKLEKEAENLQPTDKAKVKSIPDSRKSSQSMNLKANAAAPIRTAVLIDNIKKIPPSQQRSKCEAKFGSDLTQDKCPRPFQRSAGSKPSSENNKTLTSTLMMDKKRHENASPNIL